MQKRLRLAPSASFAPRPRLHTNTDNVVFAITPSSCLLLFSHQNRFGMKLVLDENRFGMKLVLDESGHGMKVVVG